MLPPPVSERDPCHNQPEEAEFLRSVENLQTSRNENANDCLTAGASINDVHVDNVLIFSSMELG